jgi:NitT/TauT family transport system substrate-binding protein
MQTLNTSKVTRSLLVLGLLGLIASGCQKAANPPNSGTSTTGGNTGAQSSTSGTTGVASAEPTKLKVAYLGLTCEAPIFVAYEKGFFKDEGLDVELVKTDWDGLAPGLGLGRFDANHTLVLFLLKPIENGLDVKITGGIHTGCLRIQAGAKTDIKKLADLRGKKIGVPNNLASPPCLFATRVLAANGMDPKKKEDVDFIPLQPTAMPIALEKGEIDAIATSEPMGSILLGKGTVRTVVDQAADSPYKDEYCCVSVVSGKLARENPAAAAKVTRALLKGAKWVSVNPTAAAKLSCEKKYIAATPEMNAQALSKLNYIPGVARARQTVDQVAKEVKTSGLLNAATDPAELTKKAWLELDGVNDGWIESLNIEKVASGGPPPRLTPEMLAAMFEGRESCCSCCEAVGLTAAGGKGALICP